MRKGKTNAQDSNLEEVRKYWECHPLFSLESEEQVGSREFFEQHSRVREEVERFALPIHEFDRHAGERVLDVGSGIGWLCEQFARGEAKIVAADLTLTGVRLTRKRLNLFGLSGEAVQADAENLPFADNTFAFVTASGVLHHTPNAARVVREIYRVLRPGGRAMISLYYRGVLLRSVLWPITRACVRRLLRNVPGRSGFSQVHQPDDLARTYDGDLNPLGRLYSRREARELLAPLLLEKVEIHYFPKRFVPFGRRLPDWLFKIMDRRFGTMIYCQAGKPGRTETVNS